MGNHDVLVSAHAVTDALATHSIPLLANRSVPIEREGKRLWLAGTEDALEQHPDLATALPAARNQHQEPVILLAHEPDFADHVARYPIDLQISGHSHGGQVRIPGYGAPVLPHLGRKYSMGLNQVGGLQVYTNRGIGVVTPPVRFNCPPEVTLITLVGRTTPSAV